MVVVGVLMLLVAVFGFLVWYALALKKMPQLSMQKEGFSRAYKFMLFRFRGGCWYWGLVFMARSLFVAVVTMLPLSPVFRGVIILAVLLVYSCFLGGLWPWKTHALNVLDCVTCCCVIVMTLAGFALIGVTERQTRQEVYVVVVGSFVATAAVVGAYFLSVLADTLTGGQKTGGLSDAQKQGEETLMRFTCAFLSKRESAEVVALVRKMDEVEKSRLLGCLRTLVQETGTADDLAAQKDAGLGLITRVRATGLPRVQGDTMTGKDSLNAGYSV